VLLQWDWARCAAHLGVSGPAGVTGALRELIRGGPALAPDPDPDLDPGRPSR